MTKRVAMLGVLMLATAACGDSPLGPDGGPPPDPPVSLLLEAECVNGRASIFRCDRIDMWSRLTVAELDPEGLNTARLNDIWGWTDPVTGTEYALVGRANGLTIVDLGDPNDPAPIAWLASPTPPATWRDVKVYADHAYIVADASDGHGIQILDLTRLRDLTEYTELVEDARYMGVSSVHNIAINEETGFAYSVGNGGGGTSCGGGLHMLSLADPKNPVFVGCFAEAGTGRAGTGYTHDVQCVIYNGPDTQHVGREICLGSNETAIVVADVTDKANPTKLGVGMYPDFGYVHQGWLSEDHRFFYQNDELDESGGLVTNTRLLVWDVQDLDDPVLVKEHLGPTEAIDHNLYVHQNRIFHSNYTFGMRVLDVTDPANPVEAGFFDTVVNSDGTGFGGSWSNYPFFESGAIVVTSASEGLFVLRLTG